MSDTGNKLVLAFGHSINAEEVVLRRIPGRKGNTLNQIGQVMDELIAAERERIIAHLGTDFLGYIAHDPEQRLFMVGTDNIRHAIESMP